jgi:hypothetical protein
MLPAQHIPKAAEGVASRGGGRAGRAFCRMLLGVEEGEQVVGHMVL